MEIVHKFSNRDFYFPPWDVKTLFLGTFNPICGQDIEYYYMRRFNGFWKILKHYDPQDEFNFQDINQLINFMTSKRFGCVDIIRRVIFPDNQVLNLCGNGYSDNKLFTVRNYTRDYIFNEIREYITLNNVTKVFSTWGIRDSPVEFRVLKSNFQHYCEMNNIEFINLPSPSGRVYRGRKIHIINQEWWRHLDPIFNQND